MDVVLERFAHALSHGLRNPLGAIAPSVYLVRRRLPSDDPKVIRALARIEESVSRCEEILANLLASIGDGDLNPEPTPFDDWIEATLKSLDVPPHVTLVRRLEAGGVQVTVDRDRLRLALHHVCDNAWRAMARQENGRLTVSTLAAGGHVEMRFQDTGGGIPSDALPRVFEPLYSTHRSRMGLGLSAVRRILERHGGGARVTSTEGEGVTVCLRLPVEEEPTG